MDMLHLGTTPSDELCEQAGASYDPWRARIEARVFIEQLKRVHGTPPEGARLAVNVENGGKYIDVVVKYDGWQKNAVEWAFKVEANVPARWDAKAREVL